MLKYKKNSFALLTDITILYKNIQMKKKLVKFRIGTLN